MRKVLFIMILLIVGCYCLESEDVVLEENRAKKKKNSARLWGLILLFIFSKMAIFKAASVYLMMAFFQKLFYIFGLFLNYFLKNKLPKPTPVAVYGAPQDYNTVGYSYGPPEQESNLSPEAPYPGSSEFGSTFDWLLNKNVK